MAFTEYDNWGNSNNTTKVTLVSAPSGQTRHIAKSIVIHNADTVAATVIISHYDDSNYRVLWRVTLAANETLTIDTVLVLRASRSLVFELSGSVATNQLTYHVSYAEVT